MMAPIKFLALTAFCLVSSNWAAGQPTFVSAIASQQPPVECKPPKNRELFHDYINADQKKILKSDGKSDNFYTPSPDDEINFILTRTIIGRVDALQCKIESDSLIGAQDKIRYLRGVDNLLKFFESNTVTKKINPVSLPDILAAFDNCMDRDIRKQSIAPIIDNLPYEIGFSVIKADHVTFERNAGYASSQNAILLKYCSLHPEQTLPVLKDNPDVPFADSLIKNVAKKHPIQLYNYAQANNRLGNIIRNVRDDVFVTTIVRMAKSKSGQQYFPFLDNIVSGKMSIDDIDAIQNDSVKYYKLLVKTQIDYTGRMLNHDTAFAYKELTAKLTKRASDVFVTTINGLHEKSDEVRFRCIQPLNAEELYYLAVLTDGLIYTSSYTKGVYPLMMKKINGHGDSLLVRIHFDHYRKFISQAAAYNTLGDFLTSFSSHSDADDLMRAFVSKLEKADGLEDGVDVADSYASIVETLPSRAAEMLRNVQLNYERNLSENNAEGIAIYNILNKLFLSADSTSKIDLTRELGIPPVYNVPFSSLVNDSGTVVAQVFFYGDKDGKGIYIGFQKMFSTANWKIDRGSKQWIVIRSTKGKRVAIYANVPLPEETGEDEKAQKALCAYLEKNNLNPTITIHRGHSYFANSTIELMAPSSKIVFMGSCGGFHLIDDILHKSEDAHIIASKQIGKTSINKPFFELLTEKLRNGNNIDWIPFWKEFKTKAHTEGFEDYIPPYKNLGAIFIKAYKKAVGEQERNGF